MDAQVYSYGVGQSPNSIARTDNNIYVTNKVDGTVTKLDLSGNVIATVNVDSLPLGIKIYNDKLYIASIATLFIKEYDLDVSPTGNSWSCVETPIHFNVLDGYAIVASALHTYSIEISSSTTVIFNVPDTSDSLLEGGVLHVLTSDGKIYTLDPNTASETLIGDWGLSQATSFIYHGATAAFYVADYVLNTVYKLGPTPIKTDMVTGRKLKIMLFNDMLYMLDPDLNSVVKANIDASGINPLSVVSTADLPYDLVVDINDDLWIPCMDSNVLNKIMYWVDDSTNPILPVSELIELVYPTSDKPRDITYDGANYWIVCYQGNKLQKVSPIGTLIKDITTEEKPNSVTYLGGYIYVSTEGTGAISKYNRDGNKLVSYNITANPTKLVNDGVSLYVIDSAFRKIIKLNQSMGIVENESLLYTPDNIEFINGHLYVSSATEQKYYLYDTNVTELSIISTESTGRKYFTTDGSNLYVTSEAGSKLFKCTFDGTVQQQAPTHTTPKGAIYTNGYIHVISYIDSMITRYDTNLNQYDTYNVGYHPVDIFSDENYIWVLNEQNQAIKILSNISISSLLPEGSFLHYDLETHLTDIHYYNGLFYIPAYFSNKVYVVSQTGSVVHEIATGNGPFKVTHSDNYLHVYCKGEDKVFVYALSDYTPGPSFQIGSLITSMASDGDRVWATSSSDSKVYVFDDSGIIHQTINVDSSPVSIKFNGQKFYVAIDSLHKTYIIDPDTYLYTELSIPGTDVSDVIGAGDTLALCQGSNEFIRLNNVGTPMYTVAVNPGARQILFDGKYTWVLETGNDTISRYLVDTKIDSYKLPDYPFAMAFDGEDIWVVSLYGAKLTRIIVSHLDNISGLEFNEAANYPDVFIATSETLNVPINDLKENQQYFKGELDQVKAVMKKEAGNFEQPYERLNQIIDDDGEYIKGSVYTTKFNYLADLSIVYDDVIDIVKINQFYWLLTDTKLVRISEDMLEYDNFNYVGSYTFLKFTWNVTEGLFYVLAEDSLLKINTEGRIVMVQPLPALPSNYAFVNDEIWVSSAVSTDVYTYKADTLDYIASYTVGSGISILVHEPVTHKVFAAAQSNLIYQIAEDGTVEDNYLGGVNPVDLYVDEEYIYSLNNDDDSFVKIERSSHDIVDTYTTLNEPDEMYHKDSLFYITSSTIQGLTGAIDVVTKTMNKIDTYSLPIYNRVKYIDEDTTFYAMNDGSITTHILEHENAMNLIGGENINLDPEGEALLINNALNPDDFKVFARGDNFTIPTEATPFDVIWDGLYSWVTMSTENVVRKYNEFGVKVGEIAMPALPKYMAEDGLYIYVTAADDKIYKIDRFAENIVTSWATGTTPGELTILDDDIYAIMTGQAIIYKYDKVGNLLDSFGLTDLGLSICHDQTAIYATLVSNKLVKLTTDGTTLFSMDTNEAPVAARFDGTAIWVAEHDNNTISKYAIDSTKIGEYITNGAPQDIMFLETYVAVVLEDTNKIAKYKGTGILLEEFAVGSNPISASVSGPYAWTSLAGENKLARIQLLDAQIKYVEATTGIRTSIRGDVLTVISEPTGSQVFYDNTVSGLTATNAQDAIDELKALIDALP